MAFYSKQINVKQLSRILECAFDKVFCVQYCSIDNCLDGYDKDPFGVYIHISAKMIERMLTISEDVDDRVR